jgi:predicted kinase
METFTLTPEINQALDSIVENLYSKATTTLKRPIFVMLVGFTHSGKTHLAEHSPLLREMFRINSRHVHELLNKEFDFLQDDNTIEGQAYQLRQELTQEVRLRLFKKALADGQAILSDSANIRKEDRTARLALAKQYNYATVIVWVQCVQSVVLGRLLDSDDAALAQDEQPTWINLYERVQVPRFEVPTEDEADELIIFNNLEDDPEDLVF